MNLRSVGALLAISAAFSCATASYDGTIPPPSTPGAGSESGGGAGLEEAGGAPEAGAPQQQAGAPASAGKGGAGKGGSGSGGAVGSAGAVGRAGSASGGSVGVSGSNMGGRAGTGSGAGASAAGGDGTAGGGTTGPCESPKDVTGGQSGNLNTAGPACLRTKDKFSVIGCTNWAGRTLKVNAVVVVCTDTMTAMGPFAAAIDGWNYFDVSAGSNTSANFYWYSTN